MRLFHRSLIILQFVPWFLQLNAFTSIYICTSNTNKNPKYRGSIHTNIYIYYLFIYLYIYGDILAFNICWYILANSIVLTLENSVWDCWPGGFSHLWNGQIPVAQRVVIWFGDGDGIIRNVQFLHWLMIVLVYAIQDIWDNHQCQSSMTRIPINQPVQRNDRGLCTLLKQPRHECCGQASGKYREQHWW